MHNRVSMSAAISLLYSCQHCPGYEVTDVFLSSVQKPNDSINRPLYQNRIGSEGVEHSWYTCGRRVSRNYTTIVRREIFDSSRERTPRVTRTRYRANDPYDSFVHVNLCSRINERERNGSEAINREDIAIRRQIVAFRIKTPGWLTFFSIRAPLSCLYLQIFYSRFYVSVTTENFTRITANLFVFAAQLFPRCSLK